MGIFSRKKKREAEQPANATQAWLVSADAYDTLCVQGYTDLAHCPEVVTAARTIADLVASMTIHIMANTESGDKRIINELSRTIDINPMPNMTRFTWVETIMMNLLLYGKGNSVVQPHTHEGFLESLEPIAADRVWIKQISRRDYRILIDGKEKRPEGLLHFVLNPDRYFPYMGSGLTVSLRDVADNLKQARATEKGFMESKWKPSLIVKVDGLTDEFSSPEGRQKLLESYVKSGSAGEPWLIPADQFQIEQVRPLTLADLAISDSVEIDKRTVASIFRIPPFVLGVGDYDQKAWNNFIQNTIRPYALILQQEMTKKLITSPRWYIRFNVLSLMDYDLQTTSTVYAAMADRGFVTGNEVRDRLGIEPREGLDELRILENFIPVDMSGMQKKLIQGEDDNE
jgi:HK97 family phage portal protein